MDTKRPKRLYRSAEAKPNGLGFGIFLDGRAVKTPAKQAFALPTSGLATAIAEEWQAQGDEIDPFSMPLTQLANSAIDRVGPQRPDIINSVSAYGGSDLICYWADEPADLVTAQKEAWDPLIDWAKSQLSVSLKTTCGIMPMRQDDKTTGRLRAHVGDLDDFQLTALADLVGSLGSLVIGLAVFYGRVDGAQAFDLSQVDEGYQISLWGEDWEQKEKREKLRADILAAERFLSLL